MKTVFFAVNIESGTAISSIEYDNEADAYLAAISDERASFARDEDGYMRPEINGNQVYSGGSFNQDDSIAKAECLKDLYKIPSSSLNKFSAMKVEFDDEGNVLSIDGEADSASIAYWSGRVSLYIPS